MKINSRLAWTDYLKAQYLHRQPGTYILLGVFVLVSSAGMAYQVTVSGWSESWPFFIPPPLLVVVISLYYYVSLRRRVRHLFEQNKELGAPVELEITPEGLTTTSQYGNSNRPWGIFRKWKENKDLLMLYITDIQFIMIPKRFCTTEQLEDVHRYLHQNKVLEAGKVKTIGWASIVVWIFVLIGVASMLYIAFRSPTP